jgi:hypothetical protein
MIKVCSEVGTVVRRRTAKLDRSEQTSLLIRMEFSSLADYWPFMTVGGGFSERYIAGLAEARPAYQECEARLSCRKRDINEVYVLSEVERRNYLLQLAGQNTSLYPLITMPNQWLVYFRYAAESALAWWHNHYYGFPQS